MKNNDCSRYLLTLFFILLPAWMLSCSGRPEKKTVSPSPPSGSEPALKLIRIEAPEGEAEYRLRDRIKVQLAPENPDDSPDSIRVFFDGKEVALLRSEPWECHIPSDFTLTTGRKPLRVVAFKNKRNQVLTGFVILLSDTSPAMLRYRVVNTYPHDTRAFTQGLFFHDGFLYEGTGQEAGSSLREVELETGKVIRQLNLDPSLFGEGITLYRDRIYQVTWTNQVGFVYDRATFNVIKRIFYQSHGWGLATVDDHIVMSDGSNILYFFEPEMFTVVSRLEVYDDKRKVDQLNELEFINGEIWANIWQTDLIARIDPSTGRVNSYIDLSNLFPYNERRQADADVLNGIAYDHEKGRIFVTGKKWPGLYEIRVIE